MEQELKLILRAGVVQIVRNFLKRFFFPGLLGGVVVTDYLLWKNGFSTSDWIEYTYNGAAVLLIVMEFLVPRNARWNYFGQAGVRWRDLSLEAFFFYWGGWFAGAVTYPFSRWVAKHVREWLGMTEPVALPLILQALIIVLLIDFTRYWMHRWMHEKPSLWRFHALHHLPERLGTMTSTRTHPVDDFLLYVPEMIVLFSLGFNSILVGGLYSVIWVISLVKHANIDIEANWFSRHFQIPQFHLRHHEGHDGRRPTTNFSEILTFWDRVFGSFDGRPVAADHQVGVPSSERRGVIRELFGWAYLRIHRL